MCHKYMKGNKMQGKINKSCPVNLCKMSKIIFFAKNETF